MLREGRTAEPRRLRIACGNAKCPHRCGPRQSLCCGCWTSSIQSVNKSMGGCSETSEPGQWRRCRASDQKAGRCGAGGAKADADRVGDDARPSTVPPEPIQAGLGRGRGFVHVLAEGRCLTKPIARGAIPTRIGLNEPCRKESEHGHALEFFKTRSVEKIAVPFSYAATAWIRCRCICGRVDFGRYGVGNGGKTSVVSDGLAPLEKPKPYSPEENRSEHVWKQLHDDVTRCRRNR